MHKGHVSIIAFLIISNIISAQTNQNIEPLYLKNSNYKRMIEMWEICELKKTNIVMLGNSITYGINWNEALNRIDIANRGISGDNTEGILNRMEYVYNLNPKAVFIMAGINDIYADIPLDSIIANYEKIIGILIEKKVIPIIQSTLYVSKKWKKAEEKNLIVEKLNNYLKNIASQKRVKYVDLNAKLSDNGFLKDDMTYDGLHLTAKAYKIWIEEIKKILASMKL
jgi:lysophospholipase L1-like esterase